MLHYAKLSFLSLQILLLWTMCVFQRVTHSVDYSYKEIHCIMEEVYYITR